MNAIQFIKDHGVEKAREVVDGAPDGSTNLSGFTGQIYKDSGDVVYVWDGMKYHKSIYAHTRGMILLSDLKRLVESVDLVNNCGGLAIANKITFQKRLRNEKATHFIQHPENQKLIQLLGRNQRKPKEAIKFDLFEQAIADYEAIGGEHV